MSRSVPDYRQKDLFFLASSRKALLEFPPEVTDGLGEALSKAQFGSKHIKAKPWKGLGSGVLEVVEDFRGNTYRAVYTVRFARAVYVLHAFQKKSKSGIATPRLEVELVASRMALAEEHYKEHYG